MAEYDVAYDIGHGSNTWENGGGKGVRKNGKVYEEHTANSDVGKRVIKILKDHGLKVYVTQQPMSKEVNLNTRIDRANRLGVKLYWSTHFNAGVPSASGVCAFYWHTASDSKKLAQEYAKNAKAMGFDTHGNGTHASKLGSWTNLAVCRDTKMTAVLCENGFMTNSGDFEGIFGSNKNKYRQRVAELQAKTILSFFGKKYDSSNSGGNNEGGDTVLYSQEHIDRGEVVKDIQVMLKKLGYNLGSYGADGIYGDATEKAVRQFQKDQGIQVDGIVGPVTLRELREEYKQATAPEKPKGDMHRVIFDDHQVGAFVNEKNVLDKVEEGLKEGVKEIVIQEV